MAAKQFSSTVPIIRMSELLIVVFQTPPTDSQARQLLEDLLHAVVETGPKGIILDISTLEVLDSYLTRIIYDIARSARELGTRTAIVGMRPAVAITLVTMGLESLKIQTYLCTEDAMKSMADNTRK